ncbi:hypothetical protein GOQ29_08215 [Clostridium sp. D2Q-14]|uniref:hypothetical protein n=1 Tax=Anaeromonas gelatinilytica TaxID=2683194 RepID=UPI00193BA086|nr:hypothetical protein [Anaeromonas gelatinilytica]MBS4535607.1 hypothetical protein [Anaeromonas gelatinilytica]
MKDLVIKTIVILIAYIGIQLFNIDDPVANAYLNLIPIAIPTIYMWYNAPKNYLKIMSIFNTNVKYEFNISIKDVIISENHFKNLVKSLTELDYSNEGRVVTDSYGKLMFKSNIQVNAGTIELEYYISNKTIILKTKSIAKYKFFFDFAENILNKVLNLFGSNVGVCYNNDNILSKIKITFIDKKKVDTKNPFWKKIFHGFNKKIISFTYQGKNNSKILISNDSIELTNSDIKCIKEDIKSELKLINF